MPQNNVTVSAGGVVLNTLGQVLVVSQRGTSWSLPKGHIDPGESPLQSAIREIHEESGVSELSLVSILGAYGRYKIGKDGTTDDKSEWKVIFLFLFKTAQMDLKPIDPDNPAARWVNSNEVENLLTHPSDRAFYKSVLHLIQ